MSKLASLTAVVSVGLLGVLTGCPHPYDVDSVRAVAVSGDVIVIGATTTTFGEGGCGGPSEGQPTVLVSDDAGATFTREPVALAAPIVELAVYDGAFLALASAWDRYVIASSRDGVEWTELATGPQRASDLFVDGSTIYVAHSGGIVSSPDGVAFTERELPDGLYDGRLVATNGALVVADNSGQLHALGSDGVMTDLAGTELTSLHHLSVVAGRVFAIGYRTYEGGATSRAFAEIDPSGERSPSYTAVPDRASDVIETPVGALFADGTLAADPTVLGERAPHTNPYYRAAVDGERVVLLDWPTTLRISTDGGATFGAPVALPVLQ